MTKFIYAIALICLASVVNAQQLASPLVERVSRQGEVHEICQIYANGVQFLTNGKMGRSHPLKFDNVITSWDSLKSALKEAQDGELKNNPADKDEAILVVHMGYVEVNHGPRTFFEPVFLKRRGFDPQINSSTAAENVVKFSEANCN